MPKKQQKAVRLKMVSVGDRFGYESKAHGSTNSYKKSSSTYTNQWNAKTGAWKALKKQGYSTALMVNETGRKVVKEVTL